MVWPFRKLWNEWFVASGGKLTVESGGEVDLESGSALKVAGVQVTASAAELNKLAGANPTTAQLNLLTQGLAAGYKIARGVHETVAAADTVVTGLATVVAVVAVLAADPTTDPLLVSADIGNQAGAPAAGSVYIKTWKPTANDNVTPVAATTFTKKVNWVAIGT